MNNRKRLAIIIDYTPGNFRPDVSDVALAAELGLQNVVGSIDLEATVFDDMACAHAFIESPTSGPNGDQRPYLSQKNHTGTKKADC